MNNQDNDKPDWRAQIYHVLKEFEVRHMAYVPDAGHSTAINLFEEDRQVSSVVLTTEEEGIGYLSGAWLGGERGVLLLQSSGVGNCINTLALTLAATFSRSTPSPAWLCCIPVSP